MDFVKQGSGIDCPHIAGQDRHLDEDLADFLWAKSEPQSATQMKFELHIAITERAEHSQRQKLASLDVDVRTSISKAIHIVNHLIDEIREQRTKGELPSAR